MQYQTIINTPTTMQLPEDNMTSYSTNTTETPIDDYDAFGAMNFIIVTVFVYGVGVMGVFIFGFAARRKQSNSREMDNQANYYLKNMRMMREMVCKEQRLLHVNQFVPPAMRQQYRQTNCEIARMSELGNGMLRFVGLPLLVHESESNNASDEVGLLDNSTSHGTSLQGSSLADTQLPKESHTSYGEAVTSGLAMTQKQIENVDQECLSEDDVFVHHTHQNCITNG